MIFGDVNTKIIGINGLVFYFPGLSMAYSYLCVIIELIISLSIIIVLIGYLNSYMGEYEYTMKKLVWLKLNLDY